MDVVDSSFIFPVFVLVGVGPGPNNGIKYHEWCRQVWKYPPARPWREINQQHAQTQFSLKEMDEPFCFFFLKFSSVFFCNLSRKTHLSVINKEVFFPADRGRREAAR